MQAQTTQEEDHFPTQTISPLRTSITHNDTILIAQKLLQFQTLTSSQKLTTLDNLVVMLHQLGSSGIEILNSLTGKIMGDEVTISGRLLGKLEDIVGYIGKYATVEGLQNEIKQTIIPITIKYLYQEDIDTKQQAGKLLSKLATKLNEKDRGEFILKYVLLLSHDDTNQNNRLVAVQLFSSMSQCLGTQLCEQFIGLQFLSLGDDTSERVRKQAIKQLPVICKLVSSHFFMYKILPFYYEKAGDRINWGIRKSCADIIISISQFTSEEERQNKLTTLMLKFLKDENKWVKLSAYLNLGKFIYLLKGLEVNEKLIRRYLKMCQKQIVGLGNQNQIAYSCAYNFPAVVSVAGPNKWPEMVGTYQKLLTYKDRNIKVTLCESLHQIAKIIGGKHTQDYLFKIIDNFLQDQNDDIKLGIIQNMSQIIFVLNDEKREKMISIFEEFRQNKRKWRIRLSIVQQFENLLEMYSVDIIHMYIVPILLGFCSDPVSQLREQAAKTVPYFLQSFLHNDLMLLGLIQSIRGFGVSQLYIQRLEYISICRWVIKWDIVIFGKYLMQTLFNLISDNVVNVRLALAELIRDILVIYNIHAIIIHHVALTGTGTLTGTNVGKGRSRKFMKDGLTKEEILEEIRLIYEDMLENGDQEMRDMLEDN